MEWVLTLAEAMGTRFIPKAPPILDLYFNNIQTTYAEVVFWSLRIPLGCSIIIRRSELVSLVC